MISTKSICVAYLFRICLLKETEIYSCCYILGLLFPLDIFFSCFGDFAPAFFTNLLRLIKKMR